MRSSCDAYRRVCDRIIIRTDGAAGVRLSRTHQGSVDLRYLKTKTQKGGEKNTKSRGNLYGGAKKKYQVSPARSLAAVQVNLKFPEIGTFHSS